MPHNVSLPHHRYVHLRAGYATPHPEPCVWFGISAHPGRAIACHVLTQSGATIVDLPLFALSAEPNAPDIFPQDAIMWDCYGWDIEAYQPEYLSGLTCTILTPDHKAPDGHTGTLWFAVDHVRDGYSAQPEQHKHQWVIARDAGCLLLLPQDRFLVAEASFTQHDGIPKVYRQTNVWSVEP